MSEYKWIDLIWIEEFKSSYPWCGLYLVRLTDSNGQPIKLGRFLGSNESGILQIGRSNDVGNRLYEFYRSSNGERFAHSEGERLFLVRMFTEFQKKTYKDSKIQYAALRLKNITEAEKEEERFLKCYFRTFGELPPLNSALMDKHYVDWHKLDCSGIDSW